MAAARQAARRKDEAGSRTRDVETERQGGVLVLTLARPDKRNSLSEAMLAALQLRTCADTPHGSKNTP